MSLVTMVSGSAYGDALEVFLLGHMTNGFIEDRPESMVKSYRFLKDADRSEYEKIMVVSRDHWDDFKKWCRDRGITVHLKKRVIDSNKTWWPSVVEIITDDESNDYLVWVKLKHYY